MTLQQDDFEMKSYVGRLSKYKSRFLNYLHILTAHKFGCNLNYFFVFSEDGPTVNFYS